MAIGTMVVAMIVLAHRALTGNAIRQTETVQQDALAADTLSFFREELQPLFLPPGDADCSIELENSSTSLVRLAFCRWDPATGLDPRLMSNRLRRVSMEYADDDDSPQLVMIEYPLTGPEAEEPPRTNWPGATWPRLMVHLYDGSQWQTNWSGSDRAPLAARILLLDDASKMAEEAILVIPAGLSVTSSLHAAEGSGPKDQQP